MPWRCLVFWDDEPAVENAVVKAAVKTSRLGVTGRAGEPLMT